MIVDFSRKIVLYAKILLSEGQFWS